MKLSPFIFNLAFLLFFGCVSQPSPQQTINRSTPTVNSRSDQLDSVIKESSNYIISKLPAKSKVGVVNMYSSSVNLSNYIIDSMVMHLVNMSNFVIIERSELDNIQNEQRYQLSGEVSDETAVSVGKQLGTQMIITGSILPLGDNYSLRLKITDVQTAQIIGTRIYTVRQDTVLISLLDTPFEEPKKETQQTIINGDVNIINNNTTTIQGDVYVNMPKGFGW
jgi:hypothetical protein